MKSNPGFNDKSLEALDFIINVLQEHEKNLDKLVNELAAVTEKLSDTDQLASKVDMAEAKINNLQKEITDLMVSFSNMPNEVPISVIKQESQTQTTPALLLAVRKSGFITLSCNNWEDFQVLAKHSEKLSFSYKEDEKNFQAEALKENQIITYSGPLPNFSLILKAWLSQQFNITEQNIFESF